MRYIAGGYSLTIASLSTNLLKFHKISLFKELHF